MQEGKSIKIKDGKIYKLGKIETSRKRAYDRSSHLRDKGYNAFVEVINGHTFYLWVRDSKSEY